MFPKRNKNEQIIFFENIRDWLASRQGDKKQDNNRFQYYR